MLVLALPCHLQMLTFPDEQQNRGLKEQALLWVQAAYHAHQAMVGGGQAVFLHRWKSDSIAPALELWLS